MEAKAIVTTAEMGTKRDVPRSHIPHLSSASSQKGCMGLKSTLCSDLSFCQTRLRVPFHL